MTNSKSFFLPLTKKGQAKNKIKNIFEKIGLEESLIGVVTFKIKLYIIEFKFVFGADPPADNIELRISNGL